MKSQLLFKCMFALFMMPSILLASNTTVWNGKHTKEKTIKKDFKVNKDALIKIKNSYGDIIVVTNNGTTASFDILIKTNGNNEAKVQQKLDEIDVEFKASNSEVFANTLFNKNKSNSWWNWGNDKTKINMEITYRVSLPMTNQVDFNNNYGSITLDKLEGRAILNCDYGKIVTKELMANNNSINFDYTKNSYFGYINGGKIDADYSDFTVGKANSLDLNADYTKSTIEQCENLTFNCDYGSLKVDRITHIKGNGDYLSFNLGQVNGNVEINQDYGSIRIDELTQNAGNLSIDTDYTGIDIGYNSAYNFNFDIELEYGNLRNASGLNMSKQIEKSSKKYYSGNNGRNGKHIKIDASYGNISLKQL